MCVFVFCIKEKLCFSIWRADCLPWCYFQFLRLEIRCPPSYPPISSVMYNFSHCYLFALWLSDSLALVNCLVASRFLAKGYCLKEDCVVTIILKKNEGLPLARWLYF